MITITDTGRAFVKKNPGNFPGAHGLGNGIRGLSVNGVVAHFNHSFLTGRDKITEEEQRYAKAYGTGILESGQFQEVMKDAKKRKLALQRQLEELVAKNSQETIDISLDDYLNEAEKYLEKLDFSNKIQVVRDIIEKVIIKERSEVEVLCHIPLPQLSLTSAHKLGHEPISRDCGVAECKR